MAEPTQASIFEKRLAQALADERAAALEEAARLVQRRLHAACVPSHVWTELVAEIRDLAQPKTEADRG